MLSLAAELRKETNKAGLSHIRIRITYNRINIYHSTDFRVAPDQWDGREVVKHPNGKKINIILRQKIVDLEGRLLDELRKGELTKSDLTRIIHGKSGGKTFDDYVVHLAGELNGKISNGRIRHYTVMANKVEAYSPKTLIAAMDKRWLEKFEAHLRKGKVDTGGKIVQITGNTLNDNMKTVVAILNRAADEGLIEATCFEKYKIPPYEDPIPEYLTEEEMGKLFDLVQLIDQPAKKLAGYYYLLSCYTGYRISDAKRFNYAKSVKGDQITLRAKKNGTIVSIFIHTRLRAVLEYIKDKPLTLSEQKVRQYVKELCKLKGIKKHVKYHTSRHSFAMMLMANGFTVEEVAELLGDSKDVAKIYARILNFQLSKKIKERLG